MPSVLTRSRGAASAAERRPEGPTGTALPRFGGVSRTSCGRPEWTCRFAALVENQRIFRWRPCIGYLKGTNVKRPTGVSVIAVLLWVVGLANIFAGIGVMNDVSGALGVLEVVIGIAAILFGIGCWRLQKWARVGTILLMGVNALSLIYLDQVLRSGHRVPPLDPSRHQHRRDHLPTAADRQSCVR